MRPYRIFFGNIGYARGIDGSLGHHLRHAGRNIYCSIPTQQRVLMQLKTLIDSESPDLCCFVEIDQGSPHSGRFNQLNYLIDGEYTHYDIAEKYGENNWLGKFPFHEGKSSAFIARHHMSFERMYFKNGTKRLIHRITLPTGVILLFCHLSLSRVVRARQFEELRAIVAQYEAPVMIMGDLNIMHGYGELATLLDGTDLQVLNDEDVPTFKLHTRALSLDLCICSKSIVPRCDLRIVPMPFSDHDALVVDILPE